MDDCPHEPSPIPDLSRKRKADSDPDPPAMPRLPPDAPDDTAAWFFNGDYTGAACTLDVPVVPGGPSQRKRPRVNTSIPPPPPSPRKLRKPRSHGVQHRSPRLTRASSMRNHALASVFASRSVASPTSALTPTHPSPLPSPHRTAPSELSLPAEPNLALVPPHQPPINRDTLKELDLEAILRNPQLRHDLLFDPGLQFRPTFSRRKRDMAANYWLAVIRELESGCTCTVFDRSGRPVEGRCACQELAMPATDVIYKRSEDGNFCTVRSTSRLRPLLAELLEVLVSIIRPVVTPTASICLHPTVLQPQEQNASHVAYLRSILDVDFIQQEVKHGVFDPSGVFKAIGDIMRCYCAPMRDLAVNQMVALADSCSPGGTGSNADAVRAIRNCFEILELMKLDVANHQLQTLRPYLVHTAAQFELKMFQENRQKGPLPFDSTRKWLQAAYDELATQNLDLKPALSLSPSDFLRYPRSTQIQIAVTKAIVNLVFDSPSQISSTPPSSVPSSPRLSSPACPGYPETLYLDHVRLTTLRNDAADFTSLYMLLMLYRQLVYSGSTAGASKVAFSVDELLALKKEIWEIGPARLGLCFTTKSSTGSHLPDCQEMSEMTAWRKDISDVVLQVTRRADEAQAQSRIFKPAPASSPSTPPSPSSSSSVVPTNHRPLPVHSPDNSLLKLATSWTDSHLRPDSPLSSLMKKRVKRAVEELAVQLIVPTASSKKSEAVPSSGGSSITVAAGASSGLSNSTTSSRTCTSEFAASGIEPLMPEIRHLADRLSKLAAIHVNVYGSLYAQPGFLVDSVIPPPLPTATIPLSSPSSLPPSSLAPSSSHPTNAPLSS